MLVTVLLQNNKQHYANETLLERKLEEIEKIYGFNVYFMLEKMTRLEKSERMEWFEI